MKSVYMINWKNFKSKKIWVFLFEYIINVYHIKTTNIGIFTRENDNIIAVFLLKMTHRIKFFSLIKRRGGYQQKLVFGIIVTLETQQG